MAYIKFQPFIEKIEEKSFSLNAGGGLVIGPSGKNYTLTILIALNFLV
jgi:hypothetical protein